MYTNDGVNTCVHKQLDGISFLLISPVISPICSRSPGFLSQSSSQTSPTFMIMPHPSGRKTESKGKKKLGLALPSWSHGATELKGFTFLRVLAHRGFPFFSTLATVPPARLPMGGPQENRKKNGIARPSHTVSEL